MKYSPLMAAPCDSPQATKKIHSLEGSSKNIGKPGFSENQLAKIRMRKWKTLKYLDLLSKAVLQVSIEES
jgi:hypothetical protein